MENKILSEFYNPVFTKNKAFSVYCALINIYKNELKSNQSNPDYKYHNDKIGKPQRIIVNSIINLGSKTGHALYPLDSLKLNNFIQAAEELYEDYSIFMTKLIDDKIDKELHFFGFLKEEYTEYLKVHMEDDNRKIAKAVDETSHRIIKHPDFEKF